MAMSMSRNKIIWVVLLALAVSACEDEKPLPVERIRAVKTIVVSERASGQRRKFPGTVEPVDISSVSFEVAGLVQEIRVDVGDKFKEGDVLAVLDKKPIELSVASAKASLSRDRAQLKEKKSAYERERRIQTQDPGATSVKAVEQARAAYDSERQAVSYSRAQLDLASRDLEKTELRAPFDGVVSVRHIEPFEDVARGKPVLELHVEGAMEVAIRVPENMIEQVVVGLQGEVRLPTRPDDIYQATVSEVGSVAETANAYPVKANLVDVDEHVRPGMTAELTLLFAREQKETAYLVPISALVPEIEKDSRHVYVFDGETSTVLKKKVQSKGIVGNQAIITQGIGPGDVLVVAGVSFLRDGQNVKLMNPSHAAR